MKRIWMILGGLVSVVIVAAVVIVVFVLSNLGEIVKTAVETYGPELTGTDVRLASADISALDGEGALEGFLLGNPEGYKTKSAIQVARLQIAVDTDSLTSDTVRIKRILIDKAKVTYEFGDKRSNLEAIQRNVQQATGGGKSGAKKSSGAGKESDIKVIIDELLIRDSEVQVAHPAFGGRTVKLPLADIAIKDIGKKEGGATPGEAVKAIIAAITSNAKKAAGSINVGELAKKFKLGAGKGGEALKDAGGDVGKAAEKATKSLKKLLGN